MDEVAIYQKLKEKDPIFGPSRQVQLEPVPRNWEWSPRRNINHEAVNLCGSNEIEQRNNMLILSKNEPIYSYQKLDKEFM